MNCNIKLTVIILLSFLSILSCVNEESSLDKDILSLDTSNDNFNKNVIIIITSDMDCGSCYSKFENYKSTDDIKFKGYYSSRDEILFEKKLKKINSNIDWKPIKNYNIISKIQNKYKLNGPYEFILHNNNVTLRQ